jgi:aryl carrier-like protein
MSKVCLIGIDQSTALHMARILKAHGHQVTHHLVHGDTVPVHRIDLIFAGGDTPQTLALLADARKLRSDIPFVVIAELPSTERWLDALEAGATDYFAAPIEAAHVKWTMDSIAASKPAALTASA